MMNDKNIICGCSGTTTVQIKKYIDKASMIWKAFREPRVLVQVVGLAILTFWHSLPTIFHRFHAMPLSRVTRMADL
jgi:hypothetical protein